MLEITFWADGSYPSLSTPILNIYKYPPLGHFVTRQKINLQMLACAP